MDQITRATSELESLSIPYGLGREDKVGEVEGEEVFRDVVRSKVMRLQKASQLIATARRARF